MKHLFSLVLVFLFFNLSAQSKWSIGLVAGLDVANVARSEDYLSELKPIISPRVRVNLEYRINDRFAIRSGLGLNIQGEQSFVEDLRWGREHDGMGGFTNDPSLPQSAEFIYKDRFIEIPLHLKMYISSGEWRWYVEGGISPNVYLNSKSKSNVDILGSGDNVYSEGDRFRKITGSVDLGFGVEKKISNKLILLVQPMFRYYPLRISTVEEYLFKAHYYNFGLEVGASYDLGK